ncbi:MAG: hypothetical protein ISR65_19200 [Bacteriovoracaceae bacterium]|nr:hypothetical protein [Bacteriovoracaceae bacterium]
MNEKEKILNIVLKNLKDNLEILESVDAFEIYDHNLPVMIKENWNSQNDFFNDLAYFTFTCNLNNGQDKPEDIAQTTQKELAVEEATPVAQDINQLGSTNKASSEAIETDKKERGNQSDNSIKDVSIDKKINADDIIDLIETANKNNIPLKEKTVQESTLLTCPNCFHDFACDTKESKKKFISCPSCKNSFKRKH